MEEFYYRKLEVYKRAKALSHAVCKLIKTFPLKNDVVYATSFGELPCQSPLISLKDSDASLPKKRRISYKLPLAHSMKLSAS